MKVEQNEKLRRRMEREERRRLKKLKMVMSDQSSSGNLSILAKIINNLSFMNRVSDVNIVKQKASVTDLNDWSTCKWMAGHDIYFSVRVKKLNNF
jgi:hypothetical protein